MEALLENQKQLMMGMDQLYTNFKKDGHDRKTPDMIKRRLDTLDSYWQEFHSNHVSLCSFEEPDQPYFTENDYEKTREFYNRARQAIANYQTPARPSTPVLKAPVLQTPNPQPAGNRPAASSSLKSDGTNSRLEEMLRKQTSNFKAFSRTVSNINIPSLSEKWEYEDVLKTLQSRWAIIDSLHWEIDSELDVENPRYELEYSYHEKTFNDMKKAINTKMWSVSYREKMTPQMDIPVFSGSYQQWTAFKDLFQETIHNNPSLSSAQKLQFLKSKLKGEAEKLVHHLSISSENYQAAWEILNHRFNNTKLIFTSHVNTLLNLPVMQTQTSSHIKRLHDTTNECLHAIQKLGVDTTTWSPLLVHLLAQKLDADSHNDYVESLRNPRELPTIEDFLSFLESKFTSLEAFRRKQDATKPSSQEESRYKRPNNYQGTNNNFNKPSYKPQVKTFHVETYKCVLCNDNHPLFLCKTFREFRPDVRRKTVAKYNLCKNCLFSHQGKECTSSKTCRDCNAKHNTLLHEALTTSYDKPTTAPTSENNQRKCNVSQENIAEILLATAYVLVQGADGTYHKMRALIDQGSQTSLITENAAQLLHLPRQHCKGVVYGVGAKENSCKGVLNITLSSLHNDFTMSTDVLIMNTLINKLPNHSFQKPSWPYLDTIQLADSEFHVSRPVDMLLGADVYSSIILSGIIKLNPHYPVAQETQFGWILCGNVNKSFQCNVVLNNTDDLQRFWEIEDIAPETNLSAADDQCLKYYLSTTKRNQDGRYTVRLPFKSNLEEKLGTSKAMAIAQFRQLEKKFIKNETTAKDYKLFINEYRELGHMIHVSRADVRNLTPDYYLPHHGVSRPDSTTTKLRVVFNASAKTTSGQSLNDLMEAGPNLQQDLQSLILKWRQYQYAFTADIEKMFRQIWVHPDDQKYQRIIWRDSPDQMLQDYQLTTVTYGTKAAPFLAMMTLKQLAVDEKPNYQNSLALKALNESFYMDDVLYGSDTIQEAKQIQSDLLQILKTGGFNLRKWRSNSLELIPDQNSSQESFNFKQPDTTKTLGLRWDPQADIFIFESKIIPTNNHPTKRSLLSDISKVFDPLGWLSPLTTKLKLIFQNVWQLNIEWDEKLPEDLCGEWQKVLTDIDQIDQLQLPRWLGTRQNDIIELHGFCDASTKAYAAVIYCVLNKNESSSVVLVAAKARLTPINKNVTLPRLELCGAVLLTNLMEKVKGCLTDYNIKTYGWIDSMVVLGWLHGEPSRWKPFVANRVSKATEIMPSSCWRYVKSEENPADCASRGLSAEQLNQHQLWWHGPKWLPTHNDQEQKPTYTTDAEVRKSAKTNAVTRSSDNIIQEIITKHSTFTRAVHVLAWVLRAISRERNQTPNLTLPELEKAKQLIILHTQALEFSDEISKLKSGELVDKKSKIYNLKPFLDQSGVIRVGGRLENAYIDDEMKHPAIIPHTSRLTELLIDQAHKSTFHGGARLTAAHLRKKYWIVGGNRATKKQLRLCVKCRRVDSQKQHQLMGDLPASRSNPSRPFYHTGVDFTGCIQIKANKGRGIKTTKGYVAVFVCMATKAVHLELVSDLTSSSFLAALRRMAARRGVPHHIYSDNGTNFLGASRILNREFEDLKHIFTNEFQSEVVEMGIEWHFIAPSWPSAGGLWERAVRSLKHHLRRVIGEQKLTYEEYTTILTQIEACLNSRPLCPLTEDPDDLDYLTPSHFLSSGPILTIFETERDERTRWRLTQKIFTDIWKRWQAEYLTQLSARTKWLEPKQNIRVNDVVLIHEDNLPAGRWALGRVLELHPGKDGYVRVVTIKTKNGTMKRPVVKLSILPVNPVDVDQQAESRPLPEPESEDQDKAPETHQRTKKSCNLLSFVLMMFMFLWTPISASYHISNLQNNKNMFYFDQISTMYLVRDEWKLIVYYNLEPYRQGNFLFNKYLGHLDTICLNSTIKTQCDVILSQLHHGYAEYDYYNTILLNQRLAPPSRQRRGLINGVGSIAHTLFGVLDEEFAEQYKKDIEILQTNQQHLANLWKNQTSVVEAEYNLLKRAENTMDKQYKIFNQHLNALEKTANQLKTGIQNVANSNDFAMSSIIATNILNNLRYLQDTLLETITNIFHGKVNIHLLKPEQLLRELNIISGHLTKDLSLPIDNLQTNLPKIYHLLKIKARVTDDYVIFEIKIPLVSRDHYDIYKTIPIPREVNGSMVTLAPVATHIAMNIQKDMYLPLSDNDFQRCNSLDDDTIRLCYLHSPLYQLENDQTLCAKGTTIDTCETNFYPCKQTWTQLHKVNTYLFSCCGQCQIRIICGNMIVSERLTKAGVMTLDEDCLIKGDSFTIVSHKQFSNRLEVQPEVMTATIPPINYIINVSMPNTTLEGYMPSVSGFQKDLQSLGDQINQLKEQQVNISQISYHDVHHYAAIYVFVAAVVLGVVAWGCCRARRRRAGLRAAARSDVSAEGASSVQCVSVKNQSNSASVGDSVSASEQPISETGSENKNSARVDKAPPPNPRFRFANL